MYLFNVYCHQSVYHYKQNRCDTKYCWSQILKSKTNQAPLIEFKTYRKYIKTSG